MDILRPLKRLVAKFGAEPKPVSDMNILHVVSGEEPPLRQIEAVAKTVRAFLETEIWPGWQAEFKARDPDEPSSTLSAGTCLRTSLFLQRVLVAEGVSAGWTKGDPQWNEGYDDGLNMRQHAWGFTRERVVDITSDQFPGRPPITIVPLSDRHYVAGKRDRSDSISNRPVTAAGLAARERILAEIQPKWEAWQRRNPDATISARPSNPPVISKPKLNP